MNRFVSPCTKVWGVLAVSAFHYNRFGELHGVKNDYSCTITERSVSAGPVDELLLYLIVNFIGVLCVAEFKFLCHVDCECNLSRITGY